jgi:hypothetical protein
VGLNFGLFHTKVGTQLRVFENRVSRKILGTKWEDWRRVRNEEFYDYASPDIITVIKSRKM